MRRAIKHIFLLLCVIAAIASCERKPLYDSCVCSNTLSIPINIDWTTCGITPQNVSVLFYNTDDGTLAYEHTFEHNTK